MVAVRILQLVEAGRLALDDTLASTGLLPDDALDRLHTYQGRRYGREITLRQLLQHRAGLRDVLLDDRDSLGHQHESGTAPGSIGGRWTASLPSFMECRARPGGCTRADLDRLAAVKRWRAWDAAAWATDPGNGAAGMINYFLAAMGEAGLFVPGSDFHYADTHYILLGMLIEKVTGRSLDLELRDAVFRPLGMRHTYLSYSTDAASHARDPLPADFWLGDLPVISSGLDVSFDWAGGGVVTTVGDLNRFLRGVQHATVFRRSATRDEMLACVPTPVREGRRGGYGLGIGCRDSERGPMWGHAGAWGSVMYLVPALDVAVTGTVNSVFDSRAMDALLMDSLRALGPAASDP
jgi:D-alanyl-D-alanine carboxypeptidase